MAGGCKSKPRQMREFRVAPTTVRCFSRNITHLPKDLLSSVAVCLQANMPVSRMRMRPWLEQMIDSNSISGLNWVDKDKTMFTIPWKHAARHGWEMDKDACLFKKWAVHTGKYVEGQTCDPKTWKANFRCAMNSLPDIEEVKDKSINKGHQAMRVFRMLPCSPKIRDKRKTKEAKPRNMRSAVKVEEDDYSDTQSPMDESMQEDTSSTQENTVDSTVNTELQDFKFVPLSEVPDCSSTVDVWADVSNNNNFYHKFEVSPEHSPDYDSSTDDIIRICEQLEKESQFLSLDDTGFLSNEACGSPGSQWSESSSADDLDDIPRYTTLGSGFSNHTDDLWSNIWSPRFSNIF